MYGYDQNVKLALQYNLNDKYNDMEREIYIVRERLRRGGGA